MVRRRLQRFDTWAFSTIATFCNLRAMVMGTRLGLPTVARSVAGRPTFAAKPLRCATSARIMKRRFGGPDGSRTRDLMNAIHARSQLRYWPTQGRSDPQV